MLTTTENEALKEAPVSKLAFQHFPAFARYIRENHLQDYVKDLVEKSKEKKLPIMMRLAHIPEDQLIELGMQGHNDFLTAVENQTLEDYLQQSLKRWENDELGILGQDEIDMEDITLGGYVRKQVQLKYLQFFTADLTEAIAIIREIDTYEAESGTAATNTYIRILHNTQKRAEEQLQHREQQLLEAQEVANMGSYVLEVETNKLDVTPQYLKIMEVDGVPDRNELVKGIHPGDKARLDELRAKAIRENGFYDWEYRHIVNGKEKMLWVKGAVTERNGLKIMAGTVVDVTDRHMMVQQLRESQEFIEKVAHTTPSLISAYNVHTGKFNFINSAFEKILGYERELVFEQGTPFFIDIVHPDDLGSLIEKNGKALEEANNNIPADGKEMIVEFKYRMRHKNGHYLWFQTYGTIFERNEQGLVEQLLNVSADITEQEEAGHELHEKNLQLQQSNASLEEYAYVASHDLKEPLRKIATFGDRLLMSQNDRLTDEGKVHLEKIINSSRRMQSMISDLLAISMIAGDKAFEPYSLKTILTDVTQTLEYKIEEKNAAIIADDLPITNIVPSQFRQLFQNLISNSLKFTRDNVIPVVNIRHTYLWPQDVKQYDLAMAPKYLQIQFSDNGIGFDNQFTNKIFTIFQRLHGRNEYEGTGIGLAICKKIVENHGGTILAQGTPGKGAQFTIIIPV